MSNLRDIRPKATKVVLERDGDPVEFELLYDLNAMSEIEEEYGTQEAAFEAMLAGSIKAVRFMLWVGLLHTDEQYQEDGKPSLSVRDVGRMFSPTDLQELATKMIEAVNKDNADPNPAKKKEKAKTKEQKRDGTGHGSITSAPSS